MNSYPLSLDKLQDVLNGLIVNDSYLASPVYYLMTGRRGGQIFEINKDSCVISVNHPNKSNSIVLFPKLSRTDNTIYELEEVLKIAMFIREHTTTCREIMIGRVPQDIKSNFSNRLIEEQVLDWRYPVQILGTAKVSVLYGKEFQQVRQRINHLNVDKCQIECIDIKNHVNLIKEMSLDWAKDFPYDSYSPNDLISPIVKLVELMAKQTDSLFGHLIFYCGQPAAFCIWEQQKKTANAFAMNARRSIPGLAEYNILQMCRHLSGIGIDTVNWGGSESEGLNRFKKKFAPIKSIYLKSLIIE